MRKNIANGGIFLVLTVLIILCQGSSAQATTIQLNVDNCTGGCNPGAPGTSMGTVILTQNGTGVVTVAIALVSPLQFVNTGLQETIDFNLGGIANVSANNFKLNNVATSLFSLSGNVGGNHFDGFGDFQYAILLSTGQGAGGATPGPLSFDVHGTNLTEASFSENATGWKFGVDVYNSVTGRTGPIGGGGTTATLVPEPTSLVLLGTGLAALGLAAWRRKK